MVNEPYVNPKPEHPPQFRLFYFPYMRFSIYIDQVRATQWGLNLSEAALFSFCYDLPSWAEHIIISGKVYCHASKNKAIEELPILTDKTDTVYRLYKSLEEKGLIEYEKKNRKDLIRVTDKGKEWNRKKSEKNPSLETNSEKNPSKLGKKSEQNSENFPTDKNTIILDNQYAREEPTLAQIPISIIDRAKQIEKDRPGLRDNEYRLFAIIDQVRDYLIQYPATVEVLTGGLIHKARLLKKDSEGKNKLGTEVEKWIRHNGLNSAIVSNATNYLTTGQHSLLAWLRMWDKMEGKESKQETPAYVPPGRVFKS